MGSHSFYTVFEHTADIGVEVTADSLEELFTNSALAMADIMFESRPTGATQTRLVMVVGNDPGELLIAWLNELLYIYSVERLVFSEFSESELTETGFMTRAGGERVDPEKHTVEMEIKAATYHGLSIERDGGCYKARIIFDV